MATISAYDSDNNFSDTSDITDYFKKEEEINELIEKVFKNSKVIVKASKE